MLQLTVNEISWLANYIERQTIKTRSIPTDDGSDTRFFVMTPLAFDVACSRLRPREVHQIDGLKYFIISDRYGVSTEEGKAAGVEGRLDKVWASISAKLSAEPTP